MYPQKITLTESYDLVTQRATSSVRSDATQPVEEPNILAIAHESVKKTGLRNSAIKLTDTSVITNGNGDQVSDSVSTLIKLSFNPTKGRTDITTVIHAQIAEIILFLQDADNVSKLLNQES